MPRKQKKYHYIYKTTNIVNNKFYIGMHSTDKLDDGYFGSGKRLRYSIKKYGKKNHITEILEYLSDRPALCLREKELVNYDLLNEPLCMNLMIGGSDGYNAHLNMTSEERKSRSRAGYLAAGGDDWNRRNSKRHHNRLNEDAEYKKWYLARCKAAAPFNDVWVGKKHTEETKQKMREAAIGKQIGEKNSQYGTCWVSSVVENITKKINKSKLQEHLNSGWIRGRKIKQ